MPSGPCFNVGPGECEVKYTIYGYLPSLGANIFFCAFFGLCMIIQVVQGITFRSWSFMIAMGVGCLGEAIGMSPSANSTSEIIYSSTCQAMSAE